MTRTMLFHREFLGYSGGHGKVRDYFGHVAAHPGWNAAIHFTPDSVATENPWREADATPQAEWRPERAHALFLAGMDWLAWPDDVAGKPVVNLVQGVRHADPALPLRGFLSRPAIRICVGQPVADAILATGEVRGPVFTIEAGLRLPGGIKPGKESDAVFIAGHKQPGLAQELAARLRDDGAQVDIACDWLPRADFMQRMARAGIVVALPLAEEGFFLPALEAMALGRAVVTADCIGNRAYLAPGVNALAGELSVPALADAVLSLRRDETLRRRIATNGIATSTRFDMAHERAALHAILDNLQALWAQAWDATSH